MRHSNYRSMGRTVLLPLKLRPHPLVAAATSTAAAAAAPPASSQGAPWSTGEKVAVALGSGLVLTFLYLAFKK